MTNKFSTASVSRLEVEVASRQRSGLPCFPAEVARNGVLEDQQTLKRATDHDQLMRICKRVLREHPKGAIIITFGCPFASKPG